MKSTKVGVNHFSTKTIRQLARKGCFIEGIQAIPDTLNSFLFSETAYLINDNETGRLLSHSDVLRLASSNSQVA